MRKVTDGFDALRPNLEEVAIQHRELLLEAYKRAREASQMKVRYRSRAATAAGCVEGVRVFAGIEMSKVALLSFWRCFTNKAGGY